MPPDELMPDEMLELDPMPGDDEAMPPDPGPDPAGDPAADYQMTPEDRRAMAESLILQDPELKATYLAGLQASQQGQMQAQEPQSNPWEQLQGDPALEFLGSELQNLRAELQQERQEKAALMATQQFISQTGADPDIAQQIQAIPAIGLAMQQIPEFGALMTTLVKRAGSNTKHEAAVQGSVKPPTVVGQGSAQAGEPGPTGKAQKLKTQLAGKPGYTGFTDKDWQDLAKMEEGIS